MAIHPTPINYLTTNILCVSTWTSLSNCDPLTNHAHALHTHTHRDRERETTHYTLYTEYARNMFVGVIMHDIFNVFFFFLIYFGILACEINSTPVRLFFFFVFGLVDWTRTPMHNAHIYLMLNDYCTMSDNASLFLHAVTATLFYETHNTNDKKKKWNERERERVENRTQITAVKCRTRSSNIRWATCVSLCVCVSFSLVCSTQIHIRSSWPYFAHIFARRIHSRVLALVHTSWARVCVCEKWVWVSVTTILNF